MGADRGKVREGKCVRLRRLRRGGRRRKLVGPNSILHVGNEAHAIFELNQQRLLIEDVPRSLNTEAAICGARALSSNYIGLVDDLDLPLRLSGELECEGVCNDLHFVWHRMRANLILLVEVDLLLILINMECPRTADIVYVTAAFLAAHGQVAANQTHD